MVVKRVTRFTKKDVQETYVRVDEDTVYFVTVFCDGVVVYSRMKRPITKKVGNYKYYYIKLKLPSINKLKRMIGEKEHYNLEILVQKII